MFSKVTILGASRGLGRALALSIPANFRKGLPRHVVLASRKIGALNEVAAELLAMEPPPGRPEETGDLSVTSVAADLTKPDDIHKLKEFIVDSDVVVYCAGGGCYGPFQDREWKDHSWTLRLNLETPAELCHFWLKNFKGKKNPESHPRFIVVGSRIAGLNFDQKAASYAAGKHGMVGLIGSMQEEIKTTNQHVLLFSPGYIDTTLLPPNATVRLDGKKIMLPEAAAGAFWRWALTSDFSGDKWHRVLN